MKKLKPIQDQYWENRESYSQFLNIYCSKCGNYIATYQKDGPGDLMRMYLDRIHAPEELVGLQNKHNNIEDLECKYCDRLIAAYRIFKKENRPAYFIFAFTVIPKESDGVYPPENLKIDIED